MRRLNRKDHKDRRGMKSEGWTASLFTVQVKLRSRRIKAGLVLSVVVVSLTENPSCGFWMNPRRYRFPVRLSFNRAPNVVERLVEVKTAFRGPAATTRPLRSNKAWENAGVISST